MPAYISYVTFFISVFWIPLYFRHFPYKFHLNTRTPLNISPMIIPHTEPISSAISENMTDGGQGQAHIVPSASEKTSEGYSARFCLLVQSRDAILHIFKADVGIHIGRCCRGCVTELLSGPVLDLRFSSAGVRLSYASQNELIALSIRSSNIVI